MIFDNEPNICQEVTLKRIRIVEKDLKYITVQFIGGSSNWISK